MKKFLAKKGFLIVAIAAFFAFVVGLLTIAYQLHTGKITLNAEEAAIVGTAMVGVILTILVALPSIFLTSDRHE